MRRIETTKKSSTDSSVLPVLLRGIAVWWVVILGETIHGIIRRLLLEPVAGDLRVRQISVFIGSAIVLAIAFVFVRWLKASGGFQFVLVGAMWVLLTVLFEASIGRFVMNVTWERVWSDYNLPGGGLMPLGLAVMFFAPLMMAKVTDEI